MPRSAGPDAWCEAGSDHMDLMIPGTANQSVVATAPPPRVLRSWAGARTFQIEARVTVACASLRR